MFKRIVFFTLLMISLNSLFSQVNENDLFSDGRDAFSSKSYKEALSLFNEFLESYPDDSRADGVNYMRSVSYFYLKEYKESINAFSLFESEYEDSAYNSRISYWVGLSSFALKNYDEAVDNFLKQIEFKSERFFVNRSYLYLGESYEKLGLLDKAENAFRSGIISGGEEQIISQSRLKLGKLLFRNKNYIDAKEQFTEILQNSIDSSTISDSWFFVGECQYYLGNLADAASKLQYYLFMSSDPKYREATVFRLGDIYHTLGKTKEAINYLLLLKGDYPDGKYYLDGLRVLGSTYRSVNELKKVGEIYQEIISLTDNEIEKQNYYFELALAKIDSGEPLNAVSLLEKASDGPEESIEEMSLYYLGQLLLENNREEKGASYLYDLVNRFPEGETTDDASLTLTEYLISTGDTQKLTLFVGTQLNRNGKYQDRFLFLKGKLVEEIGNYDEASIYYERIIDEFPYSDYIGKAYHKRALLLIRDKKNREAIPVLDTALRKALTEEEKINILVDKAITLYSLGEMDQADYAFRTLLDGDSDFPRKNEILFRQGELSFEKRNYTASAEYFRSAAESSQGDESIISLFKMGRSYFFSMNYKTSEKIYTDLSEKLSSTSDRKVEAMKMTALSIFLQQDWKRTLQYVDLMVTSIGVNPPEIRILKLLSLLALNRTDVLDRELSSLNRNQGYNGLIQDVFNQLRQTDSNSVLLIFRSFLAVYPDESADRLLSLLITDMIYITSDINWIEETYHLILPHLDDEIMIISFNQAYQMNSQK